jgi:hypothetical protein
LLHTATTDEGMYAATDDYGTSYYFRGAVSNNWVKFAGMYWRIVRINGNNTVKLIYSGTTAPTETQKVVMMGTGTQIDSTYFNSENCSFLEGTTTNCSLNIFKYSGSTINLVLNTWFKNNISSKATYLYTNEGYCSNQNSNYDSGSLNYKFASYIANIDNKNPTLKCPLSNIYYNSNIIESLNTVTTSNIGNKELLYPIGLIEADELALSGSTSTSENNNSYLYNGLDYWSVSPAFYGKIEVSPTSNQESNPFHKYNVQKLVIADQTLANVGENLYLTSTGKISYNYSKTTYGVRPVINIRNDIETTGTGTWNDPYVIN